MKPLAFFKTTPVRRVVWGWFPVVMCCLVIFIQSAYPSPDYLPPWPHMDKALHAGVYGLLAILFVRGVRLQERWHLRRRALWVMSVAAASLYGLSDEWHQSFVAWRTADALDLLADGIGAMIAAGLYLRFVSPPTKTIARD